MKCVKCHKSIKEDSLFCSYCGAKQTVTKRKRGNGSGSAYRRGSGWEAQVYVDGKKHRKSGFRTKSEALAYIPTLAKRSATVLTLSDLFSMFSDMELKYKKRTCAESTRLRSSEYRRYPKRIFGTCRSRSCNPLLAVYPTTKVNTSKPC